MNVSMTPMCTVCVDTDQEVSEYVHHSSFTIGWKITCLSPDWPVWSLGDGQLPEDLDKPIETPPLSTLLIEKPEPASSISVGE